MAHDINDIQSKLFPINKDKNIFIFLPDLKDRLPQKVINCVKPSMKFIHPYTLNQLQQFNDNNNDFPFIVSPKINAKLIKQICSSSKTLTINNEFSIKNHFISDENCNADILNLLSSEYKKKFNNYDHPDITKFEHINLYNLFPKCSVKLLKKYENEFKVKFLIIDKLLGIAIIDDDLYQIIA